MRKILLGAGILTVVGLVGYTSTNSTLEKNAQVKAQAFIVENSAEPTSTTTVQE